MDNADANANNEVDMSRHFEPITKDELKAKIDAVTGDEGVHALLELLGGDIKVKFDTENVSGPNAGSFGPRSVLGYHTEPNGLTYAGYAAGGDWEHWVFFMVYWDGKRLRGYVPTGGNPWNTDTKRAYGNDAEKDLANARKRWPGRFAGVAADDVDGHDFDLADDDLIRADFTARITPRPVKSKKAKKK